MDDNERKQPDQKRRLIATWLWRLPVLAAIGGGAYGVHYGWRVQFGKVLPDAEPVFEPRDATFVAQLAEFGSVWDATGFELADVPAVAIRMPHPTAGGLSVSDRHFAAFSRICTHLGCTVNFTRDAEAIAVAFNYRSPMPALTCPCHLSVFRADMAGKAVSGPAVDPIPRIALEARLGGLYAVGIEVADQS